MAEYIIRNNLNPHKAVKCTITFRQMVNKGEEGEPVWLVEIGTAEPHKDGGIIKPIFIHYTTAENLSEAVKDATEIIAAQIDWSPLIADTRPPFVVKYFPGVSVVSINSMVNVDIKDVAPSAGIDPDSITMTVNGIDVTSEMKKTGDPFYYGISWQPKVRVYEGGT